MSSKKSSSPTIWNNSLTKSISNFTSGILFYFLIFHPPTYRETPMATTICARIYACGEVSFAKFLFLPSWFPKLLELFNSKSLPNFTWQIFKKICQVKKSLYQQFGIIHLQNPDITYIRNLERETFLYPSTSSNTGGYGRAKSVFPNLG
jgi:hypothetical protein